MWRRHAEFASAPGHWRGRHGRNFAKPPATARAREEITENRNENGFRSRAGKRATNGASRAMLVLLTQELRVGRIDHSRPRRHPRRTRRGRANRALPTRDGRRAEARRRHGDQFRRSNRQAADRGGRGPRWAVRTPVSRRRLFPAPGREDGGSAVSGRRADPLRRRRPERALPRAAPRLAVELFDLSGELIPAKRQSGATETEWTWRRESPTRRSFSLRPSLKSSPWALSPR